MHTMSLPRTCLGFSNFLIFITSMVVFIICLWCALNTQFFKDVNYTVTKSSHVNSIANFMNLNLWVTPLSSILIPILVLTMLTSCCGILGAGCRWRCAIKSYIFLVSVISSVAFWLFFISGVYNIYTSNEKTKLYMQSSIKNNYGKQGDFMTAVWNYVMIKHECCGAIGYWDFAQSAWRKSNVDNFYPVQCCVLSNVTALIPVSPNCTSSLAMDIQSHRHVGCMQALRESIIRNKGLIIFVIILITIAYSLLISFAYCIIRGEPLLASRSGAVRFLPSRGLTPEQKIPTIVAPSGTSLENMMFVEEPPKKVVRVVSTMNPFQTYKFTPSGYQPGEGSYARTRPL